MERKTSFKNDPPEFYQAQHSCGPTSLRIIYQTFGLNVPEAEIAQDIATKDGSTDWQDVISHAERMGFRVEFKADCSLKDLETPSKNGLFPIVGWLTNRNGSDYKPHFAVVKRMAENRATLLDPAWGDEVTYSYEEFENLWVDDESDRAMMVIKK